MIIISQLSGDMEYGIIVCIEREFVYILKCPIINF